MCIGVGVRTIKKLVKIPVVPSMNRDWDEEYDSYRLPGMCATRFEAVKTTSRQCDV